MNRALAFALTAVLLASPSLAAGAPDVPAVWSRPHEPFRVIGSVYYVGSAGLSAFLIAGPSGHILIDGGLPECAPLIAANIRKLGFKLKDIRYLLINHAHFDHAGGLAELKRLTGAQLVASAGDKPDLEAGRTIGRPDLAGFPAVKVDRVIRDGEQLRVGSTVLTAHLTPGHTRGATSWTTTTGGRAVLFASSVTVAGQKLVDNPAYPGVVSDFRNSFAALHRLKADVFLNFHPEAFELTAKRARQQRGDANAFVDPGELPRQIDEAEAAFDTELARQRRP